MSRLLTLSQIKEAKKLRRSGYTKRQLAEMFEVGQTTIWENVFFDRRKQHRTITVKECSVLRITHIRFMFDVVKLRKQQGATSLDTAKELNLPLSQINYIYIRKNTF